MLPPLDHKVVSHFTLMEAGERILQRKVIGSYVTAADTIGVFSQLEISALLAWAAHRSGLFSE